MAHLFFGYSGNVSRYHACVRLAASARLATAVCSLLVAILASSLASVTDRSSLRTCARSTRHSRCSLVSLPSIGGMSALFTDDTGCATMGSRREVTSERAVTGGAAADG